MYDDHIPSPVDLAQGRTVKAEDPIERLATSGRNELPIGGKARHRLDSSENSRLHARLLAYYEQELDRQAENRREQAIDEDFYDNIQWRPEDARTLRERGQVPLVYNVISSAINWVLGTERRGRADFRVLPRRKESAKAAERKTQLLKYLSDVNSSPFSRSEAFADAIKVGVGWLESGVQDESDGEPIYDRYESWRNILWDSAGTSKSGADWRYIFRTKIVDLDIAEAMFPDRAGVLRESAMDLDRLGLDIEYGDEAMDSIENHLQTVGGSHTDSPYGYCRSRLRLIECWYRKPMKVRKFRAGEFRGEIFDPYSEAHAEALAELGPRAIVEKVMMRMHVAIMTTKGLLWVSESPYRHNGFPFTPIWCYRRGRDGMPYGLIRGMRDIQEDINKRASKALHILSSNKTIMDKGAVDDMDTFLEEVSRPDGVIVKNQGKELVINADRDLAPAHLELMSRSIMMLQSVSGVTDEAMGRTTNATAGVAIQRRQEQASMVTTLPFDNLRLAAQAHGEKMLSLVEQYMSQRKQFRITNMRGVPEYITINDGLPENDIVRTKADFVISEQDWRASVRQAQTEELFALLQQLAPVAPQVAIVMLDLLIETMDIPAREEVVSRIRQVTGMRDPDQEEPTPEDIARMQAQQRQQQLAERAQLAAIAKEEAAAAKAQAGAMRDQAAAQEILASLAGKNVETQRKALEAALAMLQVPQTARVADGILHEAGFQGRTEREEEARLQGKIAGEEAQRAQEAAAAQQLQAQQAAEQQRMQAQREKAAKNLPPFQAEAMRQVNAAEAAQPLA